MKLKDLFEFKSGSLQSRLEVNNKSNTKSYFVYDRNCYLEDTFQSLTNNSKTKQIKTISDVVLVKQGDLIFNLQSGKAAIITQKHDKYILTQNFVKLIPRTSVSIEYILFLLNESKCFDRQIKKYLQGSIVFKYTTKILKEIIVPELSVENQKSIGKLYVDQLKQSNQLYKNILNRDRIVYQILDNIIGIKTEAKNGN
ncbi:hypothetical protein OZX58_05270 [Lactobacillus sp. ESL0680]|uniref:hypothetical protein n=1 Tax=Lactobacillus sp. ESL0680 TaxID=2983210 RepID=UPI0023F7E371|nr:hypothetical protein [Lactobacillus sp. ESL0680]WEV38160.1 hypothetical protein OZX58_05270 [Lactobacillus sp. ESL0680]